MTEIIKKDIIDNTSVTMQDILNSEIPHIEKFDVSTGYFSISGYSMLQKALETAVKKPSFCFRLLLGTESVFTSVESFEKDIETYRQKLIPIKNNLGEKDITLEYRNSVTSLINILEKQNVHVKLGLNRFNHSKCYILGNNSVFIGSSNFTKGGLTNNYELNAGLYQPGVAEQTRIWFDRMWQDAKDSKQSLIEVLKQSKFGNTSKPYEVYMKMLFERFKPFFTENNEHTKFNVQLTEFQRDAVHTGLFIISEFGGTIIADATGLGKTNIGIEIIRQKIHRDCKRVLLIAPAQVLHSMWKEKLRDVNINVRELHTMESLGREDIDKNSQKYEKIDLILIDESQNFRSKNTQRRHNLMKILSIGKEKQIVLLTATPINNSIMDLYYQLSIITKGKDEYFYKTIGIPNLYTHMKNATNKKGIQQGLEKIQQLLDYIMVRRTRSYIKEVYKDDQINGKAIKFPNHEYSPIKYDMSKLYGNIFEMLLDKISKLTMAPYGIEQYNKSLSKEEIKRHKVLAHLQIIVLLKRFESSIEAVKISLKNKMNLYVYIKETLKEGKILHVGDFNKIMKKWNSLEENNDPDFDIDEKEKENFFMNEIQKIDKQITQNYDLDKLKIDIDYDIEILNELIKKIEDITIDTKLDAVERIILEDRALEIESKKVLIFTEYTATAKYITNDLRQKFKNKNIECITGNTKLETRKQHIRRFSPKANLVDNEKLDQKEIDILVSTEVLAEGQNLQDCNYVINYDLPWNPMRIVQRTGRIDRLTSTYDIIHSRACYPDKELDKILKIVGKLINKLNDIDKTIGLSEEVLGEIPSPKQFNNTLKNRIETLAGTDTKSKKMMKDIERESDIMPTTSPINELSKYIHKIGIDFMKEIPIGRRSGKKGDKQSVILAYLEEKLNHRVYFVTYDYKQDKVFVPKDDFEIIQTASCIMDEPKYLPMDGKEGKESFELLLHIDQKARIAIEENNNKIFQYVKEFRQERKSQHDKNISKIKEINTKKVMMGKITSKDGEKVLEVIKSEYLRPWEDRIRDLLAEYERSNDINGLVNGIKKIGEIVGLKDKPKPTTIESTTKPELKLVGAMFITGEKFDPNLNKKGLKH